MMMMMMMMIIIIIISPNTVKGRDHGGNITENKCLTRLKIKHVRWAKPQV
jgi:hypothetical protein